MNVVITQTLLGLSRVPPHVTRDEPKNLRGRLINMGDK